MNGWERMKIHLLYDLVSTQPIGNTLRHGGGIYGEIVLKKMISLGYTFCCLYDSRLWMNPDIKALCDSNGVALLDVAEHSVDEWVEKENYPVLYCPVDYRLSNKTKSISTIHGLRRIEMPNDWMQLRYKNSWRELFYFFPRILLGKIWKQMKIRRMYNEIASDNFKFVTVSKHSMYAFLSYFPHLSKQDFRCYYSPSTIKRRAEVYKYDFKYFLLVSGNRWEKNNLRALMALDELFSERKFFFDYRVIITGVDSLSFYKYKFKNPQKFQCMGYVNDETLASLFAGCYCLVYPSLNEGFGYPPLEAMYYGKVVVASAITSITEVCGNAAIYFNPFDIFEIKNRLLMVVNENEYRIFSDRAIAQYSAVTKKQDADLEALVKWIASESVHWT